MEFLAYGKDSLGEIQKLFRQTFTDSEGAAEGELVSRLAYELLSANPKDDITAFVATENGKIIACAVFSPLIFESEALAVLLSPMAVLTAYQKQGIGQKLLHFAFEQLKQKNIELVCTYGDIDFYKKLGFQILNENVIKAPFPLSYPKGWLGVSLIKEVLELKGCPLCAQALSKAEYW